MSLKVCLLMGLCVLPVRLMGGEPGVQSRVVTINLDAEPSAPYTVSAGTELHFVSRTPKFQPRTYVGFQEGLPCTEAAGALVVASGAAAVCHLKPGARGTFHYSPSPQPNFRPSSCRNCEIVVRP